MKADCGTKRKSINYGKLREISHFQPFWDGYGAQKMIRATDAKEVGVGEPR